MLANNWLSAIHLIGVVSWIGGLLILTLHLARHADLPDAPRDDFASFESTAYYALVLPGLLIALLSGLYTLFSVGLVNFLNPDGAWGATFHAKLTAVGILIGIDQFVHFRMRTLHRTGNAGRGGFIAAHAMTAILLVGISVLIMGEVLV